MILALRPDDEGDDAVFHLLAAKFVRNMSYGQCRNSPLISFGRQEIHRKTATDLLDAHLSHEESTGAPASRETGTR